MRMQRSASMVWWSTTSPPSRDKMSPRMFAEIKALQAIFNKKNPVLVDVTGLGIRWDTNFEVVTQSLNFNSADVSKPYWQVRFNMRRLDGHRKVRHHKNDTINLEIHYPSNYPSADPRAYWDELAQYDVFQVPHVLMDMALCLFDHTMSRSSGWDPAKSTAGTIGIWSVMWIRAYWYYRETGRWPQAAD